METRWSEGRLAQCTPSERLRHHIDTSPSVVPGQIMEQSFNRMPDRFSKEQRSNVMRKVKAQGNRSTEYKVEATLHQRGVQDWLKQPKDIVGNPDFIFPRHKLLLFVDGCFWHGCPMCNRPLPANNADYWRRKIDNNRRRDNRTRRALRREGYHVMRIWEHELKHEGWINRLQRMLRRLEQEPTASPTNDSGATNS